MPARRDDTDGMHETSSDLAALQELLDVADGHARLDASRRLGGITAAVPEPGLAAAARLASARMPRYYRSAGTTLGITGIYLLAGARNRSKRS